MKKLNLTILSTMLITTLGSMNYASAEDFDQNGNQKPIQFYFGSKIGASFLDLSANCNHYYDDYYYDNCNIDNEVVSTVNPFVGISIPWSKGLGSRIEVEAFYHSDAEFKYRSYLYDARGYYNTKATVKTSGAYLNGYLDIYANKYFTPYVGVGLGYAHNKVDITFTDYSIINGSQTNNNFSYHVDAGTAINLNDHLAFDIGLRYADYGKVLEKVYESDFDLTSVDIYGGIRVSF